MLFPVGCGARIASVEIKYDRFKNRNDHQYNAQNIKPLFRSLKHACDVTAGGRNLYGGKTETDMIFHMTFP